MLTINYFLGGKRMSGMKWFRMYSEARNDAKLRSLTDAQHRVWFNLMCYAGEQLEERGSCPMHDEELLAIEVANGDVDLLAETLERLVKLRIISINDNIITFTNWQKRQYDKDSDRPEATRERKRKSREKAAETREVSSETTPVTPMSRPVTPCHATYTDTDTETYTDNNNINTDGINNTSPLSIEGGFGGKQTSGDVVEIVEHIDVLKLFEQEFGRLLSPMERQNIIDLAKKYSLELIKKAVSIAVEKRKITIAYVRGILEDWERNNLRNLREVVEYEKKFIKSKSTRKKPEAKGGQANVNGPPRSDPAEDILNAPSRYRHIAK